MVGSNENGGKGKIWQRKKWKIRKKIIFPSLCAVWSMKNKGKKDVRGKIVKKIINLSWINILLLHFERLDFEERKKYNSTQFPSLQTKGMVKKIVFPSTFFLSFSFPSYQIPCKAK